MTHLVSAEKGPGQVVQLLLRASAGILGPNPEPRGPGGSSHRVQHIWGLCDFQFLGFAGRVDPIASHGAQLLKGSGTRGSLHRRGPGCILRSQWGYPGAGM